MRVPHTADRDFTASGFVVNDGHVLLILHAKLDQWLQPGGHIEARETPDETAIREVHEETGITMRIYDEGHRTERNPSSEELPQPFRINLHKVRTNHWHCDFAFLGVVDAFSPSHRTDEHTGQRWFSRAELLQLSPIDENTRRMAKHAILHVATE